MKCPGKFWNIPLGSQVALRAISLSTHGRFGLVEKCRLPGIWCLHLYRYEGSVCIDEEPFSIRPGYLSIFPPDVQLEFQMRGISRHIYAHFAFPAEANATATVATMIDAGEYFPALNEQLQTIIRYFAVQPRRAEVRFCDLLWNLSERYGHPAVAASDRSHPALDRAIGLIELRLGSSISIPHLARESGLSHNHLLRLFRVKFGETIEAYIRSRRVAKALHLLCHSNLPIKTVAAEVGFPDVHTFNKAARRQLGKSPSQLRAAGDV